MPSYVYAGTFSPPTKGHQRIVERAAAIFPHVIILCSKNDDKNGRWFSEAKVKELWKSYCLPKNTSVKTLSEFLEDHERPIVLIRGIRNEADKKYERSVMKLNYDRYGIDSFFTLMAEPEFRGVSSSAIRTMAEVLELENLAAHVSPLVVSALIEKVLRLKNIFLVAGKPGGGKSTFLTMLAEHDPSNFVIKTDEWNERFKPILAQHFCADMSDLFKVILAHDAEASHILKAPWIALLKEHLRQAPKNSNVFVEAAYALSPSKNLFRYIGGKVIAVGCGPDTEHARRMHKRGTPHLIPFLERIPGEAESRTISNTYQLSLRNIDTSGTLAATRKKAEELSKELKGEKHA